MTGTAATEIAEFEKIYKLAVTVVPTNQPMMRKVIGNIFLNQVVSSEMPIIWRDIILLSDKT
jgi:hypothetical protein